MRVRAGLVAFMLAMVMALVGCTGGSDPTSGTRLANGLHDLSDGTVVGLGVLEWSDLEGGIYVLTGSPDGGGTIAVIAKTGRKTPAAQGSAGGRTCHQSRTGRDSAPRTAVPLAQTAARRDRESRASIGTATSHRAAADISPPDAAAMQTMRPTSAREEMA